MHSFSDSVAHGGRVQNNESAHAPACTMEVFVKTMTGKTYTVRVATGDTVLAVKKATARKMNVPVGHVSEQRLLFAGRVRADDEQLGDCGVGAESTLHLVLRLRGGMMHSSSARSGFEQMRLASLCAFLDSACLREYETALLGMGCQTVGHLHQLDERAMQKMNMPILHRRALARALAAHSATPAVAACQASAGGGGAF